MEYQAHVFSNLPDISAARQVVPSNEHKISSLGNVICDHGLETIIGITLLHRHFDLQSEEKLVASYNDGTWTARPERNPADVFPYVWTAQTHAARMVSWVPLEFFRPTEPRARWVAYAESVMAETRFLESMGRALLESEAADVFGLALLFDKPHHREDGKVYFETNDRTNRTMTSRLVPQTDIADNRGVTLWNFYSETSGLRRQNGPAQKCAHGNSQHCCGED